MRPGRSARRSASCLRKTPARSPTGSRVTYDPQVDLRFYIDSETDEPHIYKHGVSEGEVEEALRSRADDFPGRNATRIALGATDSGRHLQVIYLPEPEWDALFVITAYDLRGSALAAFRRRRRSR